jgi:N-acetyl-alpha-D-muramate 1-phosphate uridylyltransferase
MSPPAGLPRSAMVLAAGLGTRMRAVNPGVPKSLLELGGRALLDRAIDHVADAGVQHVVVNTHHMAEAVAAHLKARTRPRIDLSHEPELLETGGGVAKALPLLGDSFFVVNSDVLWLDGVEPALHRLAGAFDSERTDAVLLFQRTVDTIGYDGPGDYFLDSLGTPRRRGEREIAPYLFTGIQLLHRRAFAGIDQRVFSLNRVYDRAELARRLRAVVHDGECYHCGTPRALEATVRRLHSHRIER